MNGEIIIQININRQKYRSNKILNKKQSRKLQVLFK